VVSDYKSKERGPMNQMEKNTEGQKPKICKMAIASPIVVIIGFWVAILLSGYALSVLVYYGSLLIGPGLAIIAVRKIFNSKGMLRGLDLCSFGMFLTIVSFILPIFMLPEKDIMIDRVVCASNMNGLGKAMKAYSDHYDLKYPTKDKWCDLIVEYADVNEIEYVCRGASKSGDQGPCHYALNPNCAPNSPNDVVLLFETKGGWNQYGGSELLTIEHHEKDGCNILFNDDRVRFIKTEQLSELKWGNEPKDEPNQ
jgi:hypothetical protein